MDRQFFGQYDGSLEDQNLLCSCLYELDAIDRLRKERLPWTFNAYLEEGHQQN
jgi:hypothetical protein